MAARALQGAGAAVMMALTMAFVGDLLPKERTGSAMGLLGTMSAVGTALGPTLGGALIAALGWRWIFLANLPLGLLAMALAGRFLPADRPRAAAGARFDAAGTLLLAAALAAYALAMSLGRGHFSGLIAGLLLAALAAGWLFLRVETRTASPLLDPALLRQPRLGAGLAMNALVSTVMMATLVVGPFYLTQALGLSPRGPGWRCRPGRWSARCAACRRGAWWTATAPGASRARRWPRSPSARPCWRPRRRRWAWRVTSVRSCC